MIADEDVDVIKLHSKNLIIRKEEMHLKHCLNETTPKWYKSTEEDVEEDDQQEGKGSPAGSPEEESSHEQEMQSKRHRYSMLGGRRYVPIKSVDLIEEHDFLVIHLKETIKKNTIYELYIPFGAELTDQLTGYYKSSYFDKTLKQKKWLTITQFEPNSARRAFPCFDEPAFKSIFEISMAHDKDYVALSNMPIHWSEPLEGKSGWTWDHFDETVPMSTYLVAYGINCFKSKDALKVEGSKSLFKVWARPDAIDQVDYSAIVGPKVLKFYEDYFEQPFPLPKTDMIAIPDFAAGAMENWGLITYRETAMLFQPNVSSSSSRFRVASVIAHELAHQWFGNLVTMKWWTDLWLNEGFATYVASLGVDHIHPEWNSYREESIDNNLHIFKFDALQSSHPVSVAIVDPNKISQIFDSISYSKGSAIIRMMHLFLGDKTFRAGVNSYLRKYKYHNAEQDDLWECLTGYAHEHEVLPKELDVETIMNTWTLQTGYPVVTVIRDYDKNVAVVNQQRYLSDVSVNRDLLPECWFVPLSFTSKFEQSFNDTIPKTWLACDEKGLAIPNIIPQMPGLDQWVIFNVKMAGLYKVKYDEKNWNMLIDHLCGPNYYEIDVNNRAQLIDDALDLAWTGEQDYDIAMRLVKYLQQEVEYIPWKTALTNLNAVDRMLKRTPQYQFFIDYMRTILNPVYHKMGGLIASSNTLSDRYDALKHKILIMGWSCKYEVGDCVGQAVKYFHSWMLEKKPDVINEIPVDFRSIVYCNAIRYGGEREWNFLWQRYWNSNVGSERQMILESLTCTRDVWIINRMLDSLCTEEGGIRKQDISFVFGSIAKQHVGYHLAKSYFYKNFDTLYK